jgi:dTDP-4-dehydrorhamnose reductase
VLVLETASNALVVRTAAFFGDDDTHNVVTRALSALVSGEPFEVANDLVVSPTYVPDLVDAMLDLAIDDESGIWHLANSAAVTWEALIRESAYAAHIDPASLRAVPAASLRLAAPRPRYSALASERATLMPALDDAIARYARRRPWERFVPPVPAVAHATEAHPPVSPPPTRLLPFSIG